MAGQSEPGRPGPAELPAQIGPGHNEPKSPKKAGPFHVRRVFIRPEPLSVSSLEKATRSRSDCPVNQHTHIQRARPQDFREGQHILGKTNMAVE